VCSPPSPSHQVLFLAVFAMTVAQNQQNVILAVYFAFSMGTLLFPSAMLMRHGPRVVFGLCVFSVTAVTMSMLYQVGRRRKLCPCVASQTDRPTDSPLPSAPCPLPPAPFPPSSRLKCSAAGADLCGPLGKPWGLAQAKFPRSFLCHPTPPVPRTHCRWPTVLPSDPRCTALSRARHPQVSTVHPAASCDKGRLDMCFSWASVVGLVKYRSLWREDGVTCAGGGAGSCPSPFDVNDGLLTSLVVQLLARVQLYVYASRAHGTVRRQHIALSRMSSFRRIVADAKAQVRWYPQLCSPPSRCAGAGSERCVCPHLLAHVRALAHFV
jgi:hypothetical protein